MTFVQELHAQAPAQRMSSFELSARNVQLSPPMSKSKEVSMIRRTTFSTIAALFAVGALAHDHEGLQDGTLLEVEPDERQITVLFEDGSTRTYTVAEDAVITSSDGIRERQHDLHQLRPGVPVELELERDGENTTVRRVNNQDVDR
jgi:hypothetical protein